MEGLNDKEFFEMMLKSSEIKRIGDVALKKNREECKSKGIPLVYSVDGKIYYELADGTVTTKTPFARKEIKIMNNGKNEFTIAHTFIKCDYCGWEDKDSDWTDTKAVLEKWEGKTCPRCGELMLTEKQVQTIKALMSTLEFIQLNDGKAETIGIKPDGSIEARKDV